MSDTNPEELKRKALRASRMSAIYGMYLLYGGGNPFLDDRCGEQSLPPVRPCVMCGKPKQHNNSFCSAECSKSHKTRSTKIKQ